MIWALKMLLDTYAELLRSTKQQRIPLFPSNGPHDGPRDFDKLNKHSMRACSKTTKRRNVIPSTFGMPKDDEIVMAFHDRFMTKSILFDTGR